MQPSDAIVWFTADFLALVVSVLTLVHLARQRQEPGATALLVLTGAVGLRAALDFIMISTGSLGTAALMARLIYIPQVGFALGWLVFALAYTGRDHLLRRWYMVLVLGLGGFTALLALVGDPGSWLVLGGSFGSSTGTFGFIPAFGSWKPVHQVFNWSAVALATGILAVHVAQSPRHLNRLIFVLGAPLVAAVSNGLQGPLAQMPDWANPQPLAHAIAASALAFGLLRYGNGAVAPVARSIVVEEMEDAVVVLDRNGHLVDVNRSARDNLGLRPLGPVPVDLGTIWSTEKETLRKTGGTTSARVDLEMRTGVPNTFEVSFTALGPRAGRDRTVMVLRNINDQVIMERELKAATLALHLLAHTDELTTLANRRHLVDRLKEEVERSRRYRRPLSLVLLDLDHFKRVNDTHGHAMGDEVLRNTARALERICRDQDMPGRMGGEEFAVLLPETDAEGARVVADRLRIEIAQCLHEPDQGEPFRVTASLGVSTLLPGGEETVEELLQAADEALYEAKNLGRNRVALSA